MFSYLDKAIRSINPKPFAIWDELYLSINRDKNMMNSNEKDYWTWIMRSLYAVKGMHEVNLGELEKLLEE